MRSCNKFFFMFIFVSLVLKTNYANMCIHANCSVFIMPPYVPVRYDGGRSSTANQDHGRSSFHYYY